MTAASALIPLNCTANLRECGFNQAFGWHDLTGAVAALGLFIAMLFATILSRNLKSFKWNKLALWTWSVLGLIFVLSAIPAINHLKHIIAIAIVWQDLFMILSGVLIVLAAHTYVRSKA
jgi:hypothetical protein